MADPGALHASSGGRENRRHVAAGDDADDVDDVGTIDLTDDGVKDAILQRVGR